LHSWKELKKENEKAFTNFPKYGNHNSSFAKEAIKAFHEEWTLELKPSDLLVILLI